MIPWATTPGPNPDIFVPSHGAEVRRLEDADSLVVSRDTPILPAHVMMWQPRPHEAQASLTASARELLAVVESTYSIREHARTMSFLRGASHLVPLLLAIPKAVLSAFAEECPLVLEVSCVDEYGDEDELVVLIQTRLGAADALARLRDFDDAWWLDHLSQTNGKITINVEFV